MNFDIDFDLGNIGLLLVCSFLSKYLKKLILYTNVNDRKRIIEINFKDHCIIVSLPFVRFSPFWQILSQSVTSLTKNTEKMDSSSSSSDRGSKKRRSMGEMEILQTERKNTAWKVRRARLCRPRGSPVDASHAALSYKPGAVFREEHEKVHKSHRRSFFGRALASHPRQPLQASSQPLFICEGRLTHPV